ERRDRPGAVRRVPARDASAARRSRIGRPRAVREAPASRPHAPFRRDAEPVVVVAPPRCGAGADCAAVRSAILPRSAPRLTFGNRVFPATNVMEGSMSEDISQDTSAKTDAPRTGGRGGAIGVVAVVLG